jgi:hypothetical protein
MYHTLEVAVTFMADLQTSPQHWLERPLVRGGTRLRAQVRPHVEETAAGPVEVADLYLDDGTVLHAVPFAYFAFVE